MTHQAYHNVVKYLNIWLKLAIFGQIYLKIVSIVVDTALLTITCVQYIVIAPNPDLFLYFEQHGAGRAGTLATSEPKLLLLVSFWCRKQRILLIGQLTGPK